MFEHAEGAAVGAASGQAACYDFSSFDLHILSHAMAIIALWQDPIQCVIISAISSGGASIESYQSS